MGFPLSLVVAYIFMDQFEDSTLNKYHLKPKWWFCFVDDTFDIWPYAIWPYQPKLFPRPPQQHIPSHSIHNGDRAKKLLPFLDVLFLVNRMVTYPIMFIVKRLIQTYTLVLHAQSHHHLTQKTVVLF